jgi:Inner membrane protein YgaP-like, transmembrane domain
MKRNMSRIDSIARGVVGVGLATAGLVVGGVPALILYVLAALMFVTAAVSFCPLYKLVGFDTCKLSKSCVQ